MKVIKSIISYQVRRLLFYFIFFFIFIFKLKIVIDIFLKKKGFFVLHKIFFFNNYY